MARELVLWLLQQQHQPQHLHPRASTDQEIASLSLREAAHLREQGQAALALQLLEQVRALGLEDGALRLEAARCLAAAGQPQRAVALLRPLCRAEDPALAEEAQQALQQLEQGLLSRLSELCQSQHWSDAALVVDPANGDDAMMLAVLNTVIASREANRPELSLALIDETLAQGWRSPWLEDNQARALVHQGLRDEACVIWEQLQHHSDSTAAAEAHRMLGTYQPERISHPIRDQVVALQHEGQTQEAEQVLLQGLLRKPDDPELWQLLEHSAAPEQELGDGLLSQELGPMERRLAAAERLLKHCEALL